jgi:hypothetical protein
MECCEYGTWSLTQGVEYLKCASLELATTLYGNIRLVWKDLSGTNTLAYYKDLKITTAKSFITFGSVKFRFFYTFIYLPSLFVS